MTTDVDQIWADSRTREFVTKAEGIAHNLRRIADEVERAARSVPNRMGVPDHAWKSQQIVHAVMWGLANLNLDSLIVRAAETDASVAVIEARESVVGEAHTQ